MWQLAYGWKKIFASHVFVSNWYSKYKELMSQWQKNSDQKKSKKKQLAFLQGGFGDGQ